MVNMSSWTQTETQTHNSDRFQHSVCNQVILDLSAAFDQNQLLDIMDAEFAVRDKALSWFRTYLKNRTQQVQIGTTTSECVPLHYGVPRGAVLGPVMFTLLTTPLQRILKRHGIKYHKYSDDLQLFIIF